MQRPSYASAVLPHASHALGTGASPAVPAAPLLRSFSPPVLLPPPPGAAAAAPPFDSAASFRSRRPAPPPSQHPPLQQPAPPQQQQPLQHVSQQQQQHSQQQLGQSQPQVVTILNPSVGGGAASPAVAGCRFTIPRPPAAAAPPPAPPAAAATPTAAAAAGSSASPAAFGRATFLKNAAVAGAAAAPAAALNHATPCSNLQQQQQHRMPSSAFTSYSSCSPQVLQQQRLSPNRRSCRAPPEQQLQQQQLHQQQLQQQQLQQQQLQQQHQQAPSQHQQQLPNHQQQQRYSLQQQPQPHCSVEQQHQQQYSLDQQQQRHFGQKKQQQVPLQDTYTLPSENYQQQQHASGVCLPVQEDSTSSAALTCAAGAAGSPAAASGTAATSAAEAPPVSQWKLPQLLRTFRDKCSLINGACFSPDSRCMYTSSDDCSLHVYSLQRGYCTRVLHANKYGVHAIKILLHAALAAASGAGAAAVPAPPPGGPAGASCLCLCGTRAAGPPASAALPAAAAQQQQHPLLHLSPPGAAPAGAAGPPNAAGVPAPAAAAAGGPAAAPAAGAAPACAAAAAVFREDCRGRGGGAAAPPGGPGRRAAAGGAGAGGFAVRLWDLGENRYLRSYPLGGRLCTDGLLLIPRRKHLFLARSRDGMVKLFALDKEQPLWQRAVHTPEPLAACDSRGLVLALLEGRGDVLFFSIAHLATPGAPLAAAASSASPAAAAAAAAAAAGREDPFLRFCCTQHLLNSSTRAKRSKGGSDSTRRRGRSRSSSMRSGRKRSSSSRREQKIRRRTPTDKQEGEDGSTDNRPYCNGIVTGLPAAAADPERGSADGKSSLLLQPQHKTTPHAHAVAYAQQQQQDRREEEEEEDGVSEQFTGLLFSPDGSELLLCTSTERLLFFDTVTGELRRVLQPRRRDAARSELLLHPDAFLQQAQQPHEQGLAEVEEEDEMEEEEEQERLQEPQHLQQQGRQAILRRQTQPSLVPPPEDLTLEGEVVEEVLQYVLQEMELQEQQEQQGGKTKLVEKQKVLRRTIRRNAGPGTAAAACATDVAAAGDTVAAAAVTGAAAAAAGDGASEGEGMGGGRLFALSPPPFFQPQGWSSAGGAEMWKEKSSNGASQRDRWPTFIPVFSPCGKYVCVGSRDRYVHVFRLFRDSGDGSSGNSSGALTRSASGPLQEPQTATTQQAEQPAGRRGTARTSCALACNSEGSAFCSSSRVWGGEEVCVLGRFEAAPRFLVFNKKYNVLLAAGLNASLWQFF